LSLIYCALFSSTFQIHGENEKKLLFVPLRETRRSLMAMVQCHMGNLKFHSGHIELKHKM